jgi:nickel-dependent lactate racemase
VSLAIGQLETYRVPWGDGSRELRIPKDQITARITFTDLPVVPDLPAAFVHAMEHPIGKPPLRSLVKPGSRVALLTGDRITDRMLGSRDGIGHVILDYLNAAGVPDDHVTLVFAPGTHPLRNADEKIGPALINRVGRYVRHDATRDEDQVFKGYTSRGNAVWINRVVAEADLVVGVGEICPNSHGGWTGGGKIILPGVAGLATVEQNHRNLMLPDIPLGLADSNPLRLDMEEAAELAGLDFKIDVLINSSEQIVAVYAGDFRQEHRAALPQAREIWMTRMEPTDINVYYPGDIRERSLESSLFITITAADLATKPDGIIIGCLSAADGFARGRASPYNAEKTGRDVLKMSAEAIARDMIFRNGSVRTASMHFATKHTLERKRVYLVCDGIDPVEAAEFGFAGTFRTLDEALGRATEVKGRDATISVNVPTFSTYRIMPWREG